MEINSEVVDVDSMLLQMFSSMATQDREVLVTSLKGLLGDQLSPDECAFYLDMNNWNLQAAVCSFFELQQDLPGVRLPKMSVIDDIASNEIPSVPPNAVFQKTWHIANPGLQAWPPGCALKFIGGTQMSEHDRVMMDTLPPSSTTEVTLRLASPPDPGCYRCEWRMSTITGLYFGDSLCVAINVCDDQILDGLVSGMSRASITLIGDRTNIIPANSAQGPVLGCSEQPSAVSQTLASRQTNIGAGESDVDTMETS